jgi:hypothetical protein
MKTREEKLANIEASINRWITRGLRATNAISKLQKRKQRLLKTPPAKTVVEEKIADTFAPPLSSLPDIVQAVDDRLTQIIEGPKVEEDLSVPKFLQRTQADVDRMKAERTAKIDKSKMPLTGKAAQAAIRGRS